MKKRKLLSLSLLCCICCTGCFPSGEEPVYENRTSAKDSAANETVQDSQLDSNAAIEIENLSLDASCEQEYRTEYGKAEAALQAWDADAVAAYFLDGKEITYESSYDADLTPGTMHYVYQTSDGMQISYENGYFNYTNPELNDEKLYSYFASENGWEESPRVLSERFGQEELSFASVQEAQAELQALLDALGIANLSGMECYSMTADTINALAEEEQTTMKDGSAFSGWTQEDEAYLFICHFAFDDLEAARFATPYLDEASLQGPCIRAIVTCDGIVYCSARSIYEGVSVSDPEPICSAEDAVQVLRTKYQNLILMHPVTLDECRLTYVPVAESGTGFRFEPAWAFTLRETIDGEVFYQVALVNAYTEQEIG